MNIQPIKVTIGIMMSCFIIACTDSGGDVTAGIGGSGRVASGSITGFGSVFVNGIEFETDSATFNVDGTSGTQDDLGIGMIVNVSGSINDDGITGTANNITFDDELQGPITAIANIGNDGFKKSLIILGITVFIDDSSTTFDIDNDSVPINTDFTFDTIAVSNNVEVSGFFDANGDIQATRIELKNTTFNTDSIVEIKGTISALSGTNFNLANLMINASSATIDDLPNGLQNGQLVEVKGTLNSSLTTILASKVEAKDNSEEDTNEFELEGIITDYIDDSNFKLGGISVDASKATFEPSSLILKNDTRIEAEGAIVNGILIATEIESEDGDIKLHANVTDIDTTANTFKVSPISGQKITITVTSGTQLEDDVNSIEPFTLNNLIVGDFVEVRGFENEISGLTAVEVDVKEQDDVVVQGLATAATGNATSGGTITVLNVTFNFDGTTDFENEADANLSNSEIDTLINSISSTTPQLIKIEDKESNAGGNPVGTADEIDVE